MFTFPKVHIRAKTRAAKLANKVKQSIIAVGTVAYVRIIMKKGNLNEIS